MTDVDRLTSLEFSVRLCSHIQMVREMVKVQNDAFFYAEFMNLMEGFNLVLLFKKCLDQPLSNFHKVESKCGCRPTFIYFKCGCMGFKN